MNKSSKGFYKEIIKPYRGVHWAAGYQTAEHSICKSITEKYNTLEDLQFNFVKVKRKGMNTPFTAHTSGKIIGRTAYSLIEKFKNEYMKERSTVRSLIVLIGIMVAALSVSILFA